ncbi:MAG: hypothetical protein ABI970_10515 [Chloroflexota bacterium]
MERITVEVSVICPTHQQIVGYMEARHWHLVAHRKQHDGPIYSRWQMNDQHTFVDIHESPEFPDYYVKQRDAVRLLADYDHWLDEYSLVEQLLRGGIIGQDCEIGAGDHSLRVRAGGFWQANDSIVHVLHEKK